MNKGLRNILGLGIISLPLLLGVMLSHYDLIFRWELQNQYGTSAALKDLVLLILVCAGIRLCSDSRSRRYFLYALTMFVFAISIGGSALFPAGYYQADYLQRDQDRFQFVRIDSGAFGTTSYLNLLKLSPVADIFYRHCSIDSYRDFQHAKVLGLQDNRLELQLTTHDGKLLTVRAPAGCRND